MSINAWTQPTLKVTCNITKRRRVSINVECSYTTRFLILSDLFLKELGEVRRS